jgi:hypothetical protein
VRRLFSHAFFGIDNYQPGIISHKPSHDPEGTNDEALFSFFLLYISFQDEREASTPIPAHNKVLKSLQLNELYSLCAKLPKIPVRAPEPL